MEEVKPFEEVAKVGYVVKLGYGHVDFVADEESIDTLKIADRDYYEILPDGTKKTEFTWNEAMEIEKKTGGKWRVPTEQEWFLIAGAFGRDEETGEITGEALKKNLGLVPDEDGYGYYWSSTPYALTAAHYLYFNSTYVGPQSGSYRTSGFTVRCVAR